jgi:hypothetical protein
VRLARSCHGRTNRWGGARGARRTLGSGAASLLPRRERCFVSWSRTCAVRCPRPLPARRAPGRASPTLAAKGRTPRIRRSSRTRARRHGAGVPVRAVWSARALISIGHRVAKRGRGLGRLHLGVTYVADSQSRWRTRRLRGCRSGRQGRRHRVLREVRVDAFRCDRGGIGSAAAAHHDVAADAGDQSGSRPGALSLGVARPGLAKTDENGCKPLRCTKCTKRLGCS